MNTFERFAALKHINLIVEHQPHASNYETVSEWLDGCNLADVTPEDRAAMIETGQVWTLQWYPVTPIGFYCVAAATLDRCVELAEQAQQQEGGV